ncbi:MAG TPA: SCO family protein [Methylomirabilota bacterium]|jgi:cytochrome oxidase Cu insertion factor (SCO1/SenC/PrrC family)
MRGALGSSTLAVLLAAGAVGPGGAIAHSTGPSLPDEFIQGAFSPAFVPPEPGSYDLPAIKRVGAFTLRDSAGRVVDTRSVMAGKIAVVSFIYTACPDRLGCPLASQTLRDLQARLRETGLARRTALVSISFDPERDHPAQLAKYAQVYDADPTLWRFLTAPSGRVLDAVLESYGQDRTPERDERGRPTGRIRHVLKVFLVDREGFIRNVYSAGFLVPELVLNDIRTLTMGEGSR